MSLRGSDILVVRGNDVFTIARSFGTSMPLATIAHISPQGGTRTIDVTDQVACCITVDGQGRVLVGGGTFGAVRLLEGLVIDTSFGMPWTFALSAEPLSTHAMVALRDDGVVLAASRADRFGVMLGHVGPDGQPRSFTDFDPPRIDALSDVTEMTQLPGGAVLLAGTRFVDDGGVLAAVLMTDR